jgi:hypothetical protein
MTGSRSCFGAAGLFAGLLLLASCNHMGESGDAPFFPRLKDGAGLPAANARLTGTLVRDGDFLRVAGGGNVIIVWPRTAGGSPGRLGINTIVVWPRDATVQRRREGPGTVVVVWPRAIGVGTPVRVGEPVELTGIIMTDDIAGRAGRPIIMTDDIAGREAGPAIITTDDIAGRLADCPRDRGCTGPVFVASEFRPAPAGSR